MNADQPIDSSAGRPDATAVRLGDVQETLLIPLYFRAKESARSDALFHDPHAARIVPTIAYDFSRFDAAWQLCGDVVVRTTVFDRWVGQFIDQHPDAVIVNLGAGLDARFWRLDNGSIRWFDLDMPDSIDLRNAFLPAHDRVETIAMSLFDTGWMDRIERNAPLLFVAEALLFYFPRDEVRDVMAAMAKRFPGSTMMFQSVAPEIAGRASSVPLLRQTNAQLHWGLHTGRELESWDIGARFIRETSLVDHHPQRWRWYRWARHVPRLGRYLREVMKVTEVRLGEAVTGRSDQS